MDKPFSNIELGIELCSERVIGENGSLEAKLFIPVTEGQGIANQSMIIEESDSDEYYDIVVRARITNV